MTLREQCRRIDKENVHTLHYRYCRLKSPPRNIRAACENESQIIFFCYDGRFKGISTITETKTLLEIKSTHVEYFTLYIITSIIFAQQVLQNVRP